MDKKFEILEAAITKSFEMIEKLDGKQMYNAMVNIDKIIPCFGGSAFEYLTVNIQNNVTEYLPATKEQFTKFLENKKEMLRMYAH